MHIIKIAAAVLVAGLLAACGDADEPARFLGYVEGDFLLIGADESGRIESLAVRQGDSVDKGATLFALEATRERAALEAAQARYQQSQTALRLARVELERALELFRQSVVARSRVDDAQSTFDSNVAAVTAARADVGDARTQLARREVASPDAGSIEQVYFRPGEIVMAGRPVVSLLPPGNVKVRFYVPEPARPAMRIGATVAVSCDGCAAGLTAVISFVAREAEYAPPVIFSSEERAKLVFLVEARPDDAARTIPVGQPVTVALRDAGEASEP
jgi:HlyD family secretion protein